MRDEQYFKMRALSEKLTDVVLDEADPDEWPGAGIPLCDLTREDRGNRYWCKKNAAATLAVLTRVHQVIGITERAKAGKFTLEMPGEDGELDKEIALAEKEATKILRQVQSRVYDRKR